MLYWAFVRWISTGPRLRVAVGGFLLAGAGLTLVALAGTNWIDKFAALGAVQARLPRIIRGLPGAEEGFQPNAVAGCLVLFIPLQIALLLRAARAPAAHALAAHQRLRRMRLRRTGHERRGGRRLPSTPSCSASPPAR